MFVGFWALSSANWTRALLQLPWRVGVPKTKAQHHEDPRRYISVYIYTCIHRNTWIYTYMHKYLHMYIYVYVCIYIYIHIHMDFVGFLLSYPVSQGQRSVDGGVGAGVTGQRAEVRADGTQPGDAGRVPTNNPEATS